MEALSAYISHLPEVSDRKLKLLILHGTEGSGKSAVVANLAKNLSRMEGWTGSVCVMRHLGASTESESLQQLTRSLLEHLCLLAGVTVIEAESVRDTGRRQVTMSRDVSAESTKSLAMILFPLHL